VPLREIACSVFVTLLWRRSRALWIRPDQYKHKPHVLRCTEESNSGFGGPQGLSSIVHCGCSTI
jgi:hypothetical protein